MTAPVDHRETADNYHSELFRRGGYRVIVCKDGLQWILQRSKGASGRGAGPRWVALGYCVTRQALSRLWLAKTGGPASEFAAMPERFLRGARGG